MVRGHQVSAHGTHCSFYTAQPDHQLGLTLFQKWVSSENRANITGDSSSNQVSPYFSDVAGGKGLLTFSRTLPPFPAVGMSHGCSSGCEAEWRLLQRSVLVLGCLQYQGSWRYKSGALRLLEAQLHVAVIETFVIQFLSIFSLDF